MTNVICVGYPKSGVTWLTRLTAELIHAPVIGFWDEPDNPEQAIEGESRRSNYRVYKAHQQYNELNAPTDAKIIYIRRHIKDVILSGARYFDWPEEKMAAAVTGGIRDSKWMKCGVKQHLEGYIGKALIISYEDLYRYPLAVAIAINKHIGVSCQFWQLIRAIENQSFESKRNEFISNKDVTRANLLRVGKIYQYRK